MNTKMMRSKTKKMRQALSQQLWLSAVVLCAALFGTSPAQAQLESILQQLEAEGQARVIVMMKQAGETNPGTGTGTNTRTWAKAASTREQRAMVSQMRRRLDPELARRNLVVQQSFSSLPFVGMNVDRQRLGALMALEGVAGVYPVVVERKAQSSTRARGSSSFETGALASSVPSIDIEDAWAQGYEGAGYTVAVIDGGIATGHPMLSGKSVGDACFSATFGTDTVTECPSGQTPEIGVGAASNCPTGSSRCDHGTHVASIAVGNDGENFGVARQAQLMPIDVFSEVTSVADCGPDSSPCQLTDSIAVLDALNYINENAETHNVVAVNLSLGGGLNSGPCDTDPRKFVVDMLREKGIATVAATGNESANGSINAPACISSVRSVGATTDGATVASFSNHAAFVDVMAPGVNIVAADPDGGLVSRSGTSMATPHVAGAYAVIRSALESATSDATSDTNAGTTGDVPEDAAEAVSLDEIDAAITASGLRTVRAGQNFSVPRLRIHRAILSLQGVSTRIFNNVIGSRVTGVGQSFVRLQNATAAAGRVRVTLRDAESGTELGRWTSPNIPAHASFQFNVDRLEREAVADVQIATDERVYYNLVVESDFEGSMQHILWQRTAGVISNMTSCADGLSGGERSLVNVHSPSLVSYPSSVRIYNSGSTRDEAVLTIYNSNTGEEVTQWTSPTIEVGAALEVSVADLVQDAMSADDLSAGDVSSALPSHLNVEMENGFTGHLQHTVRNTPAGVLTDMSAKCTLGVDG